MQVYYGDGKKHANYIEKHFKSQKRESEAIRHKVLQLNDLKNTGGNTDALAKEIQSRRKGVHKHIELNNEKLKAESKRQITELDRLISYPYQNSEGYQLVHLNFWKYGIVPHVANAQQLRQVHFAMVSDVLGLWKEDERGTRNFVTAITKLKISQIHKIIGYNCDGVQKDFPESIHGVASLNTAMLNKKDWFAQVTQPREGAWSPEFDDNHLSLLGLNDRWFLDSGKALSDELDIESSTKAGVKSFFTKFVGASEQVRSMVDQCAALKIKTLGNSKTTGRCGNEWEYLDQNKHLIARRLPSLPIFIEGKDSEENYKKHLLR